jgi:sialate O-acetylesterase
MNKGILVSWLFICFSGTSLLGTVQVNPIFGDHMVLQRDKPIVIWGTADPDEAVEVSLQGVSVSAKTGPDGDWSVELPPMTAGGPYELIVSGENTIRFGDVMLGEVWVASGQSNMQWTMERSLDYDLETALAHNHSRIRFIPVRNQGSQDPQSAIEGKWHVAQGSDLGKATAVGYHFAKVLEQTLDVPIGIIDTAWGGSAAEAWVDRNVIRANDELSVIHERWVEIEADYDFASLLAQWEQKVSEWEAARAAGNLDTAKPRKPSNRMTGQHRPGNLWNARVLPVAPISMRGVIWYQGESNASDWVWYRELFSTLISQWRALWGEEFPFYWAQLADYRQETYFSESDKWPYIREAQTQVMGDLSRTGQAILIDAGEGKDIHPRDKATVGRRLARWALHQDYGYDSVTCHSPQINTWSQNEDIIELNVSHVGSGLRAFDSNDVSGFVVRQHGEWIPVTGRVQGKDSIVLKLENNSLVDALRYAWADNPICNVFSYEGLPLTPFRSDSD